MLKRLLLAAVLLAPALAFAQATAPAAPQATKEAKPAAKVDAAPAATAPKVLLKTSMGDITIELAADKAPKSTANFLAYVNSGFYDGTVFHRVIDNFMVQGGGFTKELQQKPTRASIVNESKNGLSNVRGSVALARTADPNSATAQFFINVVDNPQLDYASDAQPGYCVFGKVVAGLDVIDKIKVMPTGPQNQFRSDVPTAPIVIEKASVLP
jgi:peptidyl-prolyl cis-trans isomerase A (cyclophilin A)/peptidyl-prolyl cis-trans isomerase B (cyclophilin B)